MQSTVSLTLWALVTVVGGSVLNPPYFNLAAKRKVDATATCGEQDGRPIRELYCSLGGANVYSPFQDPFNYYIYKPVREDPVKDEEESASPFGELKLASTERIVQGGQNCEWCDGNQDRLSHPPSNMVDGSPRWWQSPPLSRGMQYNQINITIHLQQEFHVAYVSIHMANSPRPGAWVLERSIDHGQNWLPWQYFAETPSQCEQLFGPEALQPLLDDDSVICNTGYSRIVPLQNGQIYVRLLDNRPSRYNFSHSEKLQMFTRATSVRLRLLQTKTLRGHLMDLSRSKDPTITRRYFYSIKEVEMGGRCVCHGHAQTCDILDQSSSRLLCRCEHNTCGDQCQRCCPGYEQKNWQPSREGQIFTCEPCNCHGHSNECDYDEELDKNNLSLDIHGQYRGGGKCRNCRDNTEGTNCDKCVFGYYRPAGKSKNETDACIPCECDPFKYSGGCDEETGKCQCNERFVSPECDACASGYYDYPECKPCDCNFNGTKDQACQMEDGQCPCKDNYGGQICDQCALGFFNVSAMCTECVCDDTGSVNNECNITSGQCSCKNNFGGLACSQCNDGYYDHPQCTYCDCDPQGSEPEVCDKESGQCLCKVGYTGDRCDKCNATYYNYPNCTECGCDLVGSESAECNVETGACACKANFTERQCDKCAAGFYDYPSCMPCDCDKAGSRGSTCDDAGNCFCKHNFDGHKCEVCKHNFFNYPVCEECNCDPEGVTYDFRGCGNVPPGELCTCKSRVIGRTCNQCIPTSWKLSRNNPEGCQDCGCQIAGTLSGLNLCDDAQGQCHCKSNVDGRQCDKCQDGFYNLNPAEQLGCTACTCDVGGSYTSKCDQATGQCVCKPRVEGLDCSKPIEAHYFPDLWHLKHEAEDGRTPDMRPVRFAIDETKFPDYSWKGFAVFSPIQDTIQMEVGVPKPNVYRVLLHYVNPTDVEITAKIKISPVYVDSEEDIEQELELKLPPSQEPTTAVLSKAGDAHPFVLNTGRWLVDINTKQRLFLDYVVLLPAAYYEATLLQDKPRQICKLNSEDGAEACLLMQYPSLPTDGVTTIYPVDLYTMDGDTKKPLELVPDEALPAGSNPGVYLRAEGGLNVSIDADVATPGPYVLLVEYHNPDGPSTPLDVTVGGDVNENSELKLHKCDHSTTCRDLATRDGQPAVFNLDKDAEIKIQTDGEVNANFVSAVLIPEDQWHMDYLRPAPKCIHKNGNCEGQRNLAAPNSQVVEAEGGKNVNKTITGEKLAFPVTNPEDTGVVALDSSQATVSIAGNLSFPGHHIFLVHYYNPKGTGQDIDVIIGSGDHSQKDDNTTKFEAVLPVEFCPSVSGCRAVIKNAKDGANQFFLQNNFLNTFVIANPDETKETVYLDSMTVVPFTSYSHDLLEPLSISRANEFLEKCSENDFKQDPATIPDFCKSKTFSLTTDFSSGSLECGCDSSGSTSFTCENFGGQCPCKDNVIGKKCTQCKSGYFGFPNCQRCDCGSQQQCHPTTGQCLCPLYVTGVQCDQCVKQAFGYDALIGCQLCQCHPDGSELGHGECDPNNGQCLCKNNVGGRQCDTCLPGYHSFPDCLACACERTGTTDDICDQNTAACICKKNVMGQSCETCVGGTFNLEQENPVGCTSCFCFGTTQQCRSSNFAMKQVTENDGWSAVPAESASTIETSSASGEVRLSVPENTEDSDATARPLFFAVPAAYLDHGISAYGAELEYKVSSIPVDDQQDMSAFPDLVLQGHNLTAEFWSYEQPPDPREPFLMKLKLTPDYFKLADGSAVSRAQLMLILKNIKAIHIKASYFERIKSAMIQDLSFKVADLTNRARPENSAAAVEECVCPAPYTGTSCQECADGYYRVSTGPYLGACVPCNCYGHSSSCDKVTGICKDCRFDTTGDHCEECAVGYYGNATRGTQLDCNICPCPHPTPSNNFATSCNVTSEGNLMKCACSPGYTGDRCEMCDTGYFGEPLREGGTCTECNCNENNDLSAEGSCDRRNGYCSQCQNNTAGYQCETCIAWYFGDAIEGKNCTDCGCDQCGSHFCDVNTGVCECKTMVVGEKCDKCQSDTWGFNRCDGCRSCNCAEASLTSQCDLESGQCACMNGVDGMLCDRCKHGFWNYASQGCTKCDCESDLSMGTVCDVLTGQCQCMEGATGPRCDQCLDTYLRIPEKGCLQCDECVHVLAQDFDWLGGQLQQADQIMGNVSIEAFAGAKLKNITDVVGNLEPRADSIAKAADENGLANLEGTSKSLLDRVQSDKIKAERAAKDSNETVSRAEEFIDKFDEALLNCHKQSDYANEIVARLENLASGLGQGTNAAQNREMLVKSAQKYLETMQNVSLNDAKQKVDDEREQADSLLETVRNGVVQQGATIKQTVNDTQNPTQKLIKDLEEGKSYLEQVKMDLQKANDLNKKIESNPLYAAVPTIDAEVMTTKDNLEKGREAINSSTKFIADLKGGSQNVQSDFDAVNSTRPKMQEKMERTNEAVTALQEALPRAHQHVQLLDRDVDAVTGQFVGTRDIAQNAVSAAKAHQDIVQAIDNASLAAQDAKQYAFDATNIDGEEAATNASVVESMDLLRTATTEREQVVNKVAVDLKNEKEKIEKLGTAMDKQTETLQEAQKQIDAFEQIKNEDTASKAIETAAEAMQKAETAQNFVKDKEVQINELRQKGDEGVGDASEVDRNMKSSKAQLDQVSELVPTVVEKLNDLQRAAGNATAALNNVEDKLEALRKKIAMARDVANRIGVGARLNSASSVRVQTPDKVSRSAAYTSMSLYFKTEQNDGLLLFFGNEIGTAGTRAVPTDDFFALEISQGKPKLVVDLGSGPLHLQIDQYVADGDWHKLTAERTGKVASIRLQNKEGGPLVNNGTIPGSKSVFNLHQQVSKLYVGGVPDAARISNALRSRHFIGDIEDLKLHGKSIGLWNFALDGKIETYMAPQRDQLRSPASQTGVSLETDGYVVMNRGSWNPRKHATLDLSFKTYAKDGLMFYIGKEPDFMSIELNDGRVTFSFDLGSGIALLQTEQTYSDGQWHKVRAQRQSKDAYLTVDGATTINGSSPGKMFELGVTDVYYVGGFPNAKSDNTLRIFSPSFYGCIDGVMLDGSKQNLNKQRRQALSVEPGCPASAVRLVSFNQADGDTKGRALFTDRVVGPDLEVTLRFKTHSSTGLLFDLRNKDQNMELMLTLEDNHLILQSSAGEDNVPTVRVELSSASDGHWHYVSAIKNELELRLDVDDLYSKEEPLNVIESTDPGLGTWSLGSSPNSDVQNFVGCIGDVTVQGERIDFAHAQVTEDGNAVSLTGCPMEESVPEIENEPADNALTTDTVSRPYPDTDDISTAQLTSAVSPLDDTDESCSLPRTSLGQREDSTGHRFGLQPNTRLEYQKLPSTFDTDGSLSLEFRATASNGLLIFATNPKNTDYYTVYMREGKIVFSYDSGSGPAIIESVTIFVDAEWHKVECKREGKRGWLYVDDVFEGEGESEGVTETVDTRPPFFVGGLPPEVIPFAAKVIGESRPVFSGCIRKLQLDKRNVQEPEEKGGVVPCSTFTEQGMYFGPTGGYAVLDEQLHVGQTFSVELELRPRVMNAVVMSVSTPDRDYLTLQLIDGRLRFAIDNGGGRIIVEQKDTVPPLCDGHWHLVKILKTKNLVTIAVDNVSNMKFESRGKTTDTDTKDPFYLGGVPAGYRTNGLEPNIIRGGRLVCTDIAMAEGAKEKSADPPVMAPTQDDLLVPKDILGKLQALPPGQADQDHNSPSKSILKKRGSTGSQKERRVLFPDGTTKVYVPPKDESRAGPWNKREMHFDYQEPEEPQATDVTRMSSTSSSSTLASSAVTPTPMRQAAAVTSVHTQQLLANKQRTVGTCTQDEAILGEETIHVDWDQPCPTYITQYIEKAFLIMKIGYVDDTTKEVQVDEYKPKPPPPPKPNTSKPTDLKKYPTNVADDTDTNKGTQFVL